MPGREIEMVSCRLQPIELTDPCAYAGLTCKWMDGPLPCVPLGRDTSHEDFKGPHTQSRISPSMQLLLRLSGVTPPLTDRCRANMNHETVTARVWPCLSSTSLPTILSCCLFARTWEGWGTREGWAPKEDACVEWRPEADVKKNVRLKYVCE